MVVSVDLRDGLSVRGWSQVKIKIRVGGQSWWQVEWVKLNLGQEDGVIIGVFIRPGTKIWGAW